MRRRIGSASGVVPRFGRTWIAVQAALAVVFVGYLLANQGVRSPFAADPWQVDVVLADASGLDASDRNAVTVAGVESGRVTDVRYDDGQAVARLEMEPETRGKVHADTEATVVPRSALNDLTLELSPGTSTAPALEPGATIPPGRTHGAVAADRVLETLDADTRSYVQVLVDQLAVGLDGHSTPLRRALAELDPVSASTSAVADRLADRRRLLTRLVGQLDTVFTTLGASADDINSAIAAARLTVDTTASRDTQVAAALERLPGTLAALDGALAAVERLAGPLDPALERLRPVARELPPALAALREATPEARRLVREVGALGRDGADGANALRTVLERLGPAAGALRSPVRRLEPSVAAIDKNKEGIGRLGDRFSGVFSTNDENGPILRGLGFFEPFNPENFGAPDADGAELAALKTKTVRALKAVCLRQNELACLARYLVPGLPGAVR